MCVNRFTDRHRQPEDAALLDGSLPQTPPGSAGTLAQGEAGVAGVHQGGAAATYDSQCVLRVLTGVGGSSEPLLPEEMEWVVLMNVKHYLREQPGTRGCAYGLSRYET